MAFYRQLLVFTVPSVAVLFGIYWYRRRRGFGNCDPGGRKRSIKNLKEELEEISKIENKSLNCKITAPTNIVVKSAPIDIIPNGSHSQRSSPVEISDKDLDLELEKVKSYKLEMETPYKRNSKENTPPAVSIGSPVKSAARKSQCDRDESVISCLSEQLKNCTREEPVNNADEASIVTPANEENQTGSVSLNRVKDNCSKTPNLQSKTKLPHIPTKDKAEHISNEKKTKTDKVKNRKGKKDKRQTDEKKLDSKQTVESKVKSTEDAIVQNESIARTEKSSLTMSVLSENDISLRDSANHSPCDNILTSPSNGHFFDNHSEGSNDSGKGCSESPSPPPTSAGDIIHTNEYTCHHFFIQRNITGILIGAKKSFFHKLNNATKAKIYMKEYDESSKENVCVIEGTQQDIDIVLDLIRQKLPERRFPQLSLKDVTAEILQDNYSNYAYHSYMNLVEGVNNDVTISCYVSPVHLFVQQPTHPTYPSLHLLHTLMGTVYQDQAVPRLPMEVGEGMVCAAPTANNWYRTLVVSTNKETDTSIVKLVDFGGFMDISNTLLKQIRQDFMLLPFQATEIHLANIAPIGEEWSPDAVQIVAGLTTGQLLQAQVVGYTEDHVPLIYLYLTLGPQQVIFINQELVSRGLAKWVE